MNIVKINNTHLDNKKLRRNYIKLNSSKKSSIIHSNNKSSYITPNNTKKSIQSKKLFEIVDYPSMGKVYGSYSGS